MGSRSTLTVIGQAPAETEMQRERIWGWGAAQGSSSLKLTEIITKLKENYKEKEMQ